MPVSSARPGRTLLIRGPRIPRSDAAGCVATIGNFDGLHRGHQAVVRQLKQAAAERGLPTAVVLFEPQPAEFFDSERAPGRILRFREKFEGLRALGIDQVLALRFSHALAAMDARAFVREILVDGLGMRHLVVGDDFRFGKGRAGDFALLEELGAAWGFGVERMHTFDLDGGRVSSTRVRTALAAGDYAEAERLLGRGYRIGGRVAHGGKLGREIGFPTLNIPMRRNRSPVSGIFAVRVFGEGLSGWPGVGYVGRRPTVQGLDEHLEVHLFDFSGHLYGLRVQVEIRRHLREDRRFDSVEAMTAQIHRDAAAARHYFENEHE